MPRGEPYLDRRVAAGEHLISALPKMSVKQIAHREGLAVSTVQNIAGELGIDLKLYTRRRKLVWKYLELLTQQEALLTEIEAPIYKKEQ